MIKKMIIVAAIFLCSACTNLNIATYQPIISNVLSTVCMVKWEEDGVVVVGGTGVCVYKTTNSSGEKIAYILTAKHVAETPMYFPIIINNDTIDNYNSTEPIEPLQLKVYEWQYDKYGRYIDEPNSHIAEIVWKAQNCDAALLKIQGDIQLQTANMMSIENCQLLTIGDRVVCCSCPMLLPPLVNRGNIARFDLFVDNFGLTFDIIALNIIGGSSGGPIFLEDTYEIIGIVSIGYGPGNITTHVCGATPILDIQIELLDTKFNFIVEDE